MKLKGKLLLPLLGLGALLAVAAGFVAHRSSRGALEAWMIDRARLFAASIETGAVSAEPELAIRRIVDSLTRFEGVSEIVVVGGEPPRVLATNLSHWLDLPLERLPGRSFADDLRRGLSSTSDSFDLEHADGTLIDYTASIGSFPVGDDPTPRPAAVMIHLSSKSLKVESALAAQRSMAWAAAGVAALTAAVLAIVALLVLRPTSAIVRTLEARGAGARNARASIEADDEIGAVAAALNSMLDTIDREESRRREVEEQNRRLLDQLRNERDRAQAGERAKSDFLATMSHEIRTPMNGILGFADLLRDTELAPDQREYVTSLRRSARALLALLDDVLDFSKIEAGRMTMDSAPFDLAEIAGDVAELFFEPCAKKGVDLVVDVARDAPTRLIGDPDRVRQIFVNLVGNAVKFTAQGAIRIVISRSPDSSGDAPRPLVEVKDTGIGIPEDARPKLFQRFQQVDVSTTRRFGGTGLGLAICKRLVEQMGGAIGIQSEVGIGSTFWFTLALPRDPAAPRADGEADAPRGTMLVVTTRTPIFEAIAHGAASLGFVCTRVDDVAAAKRSLETMDGAPLAALAIDLRSSVRESEPELGALLDRATTRGIRRIAVLRPQEHREASVMKFDAYLYEPVARAASLREALLETAVVTTAEPADAPTPIAVESTPRSMRVLVAEDNAVNQKLVRVMLERLGCEVELANDGDEAVVRAAESKYDLILMDCQMPGLDGYEAARRIRRGDGSSARTPIVALTANALADDRARCLGAGMDDYLAKPFRSDDLRAMLERHGPSPRS